MGDMTIRFRRVTPRIVSGLSRLAFGSFGDVDIGRIPA
jgi:hypothetical protein